MVKTKKRKKRPNFFEKLQKPGKRAGRGSHGSTTKAGKVRSQTPKVPPQEKGPRPSPRLSNRRKYQKFLRKKRLLIRR